jgi:hypothetical protein
MTRIAMGVFGALAVLAGGASVPAQATDPAATDLAMGGESVCAPRDRIVSRLEAKFQERQSAIGMTNGGSLVELFVSPDGSWTFVHTRTNGLTCLLHAGEDWEEIEQPAVPKADAKPS